MVKYIFRFILKIFKKIILFTVNVLVLIISLIIPKSDKIIVIGGWFGKRFADNSKHFFLYVNENRINLGIDKIVWITRKHSIKEELRNKGFDAYMAWSFYSIWYHLRAKIHLIDQSPLDINSFFSVRSVRINLWHGFPLKKIGVFVNSFNERKNLKNISFVKHLKMLFTRGYWGKMYILTTSKFSAEILGEAFDVSKEKIIISGYPRNYETIISNPIKYVCEKERQYLNIVEKAKEEGNTIIGYFPTFRDKKETLIFGTKDCNELGELLNYFKSSNIKVICKSHFAGKDDKFGDMHNHEAFINLPSDSDVYTFLSKVDILITDYSSIYFDYLLWKRPIIFFPYDLDYYRDEDRGLIFDYDEYTPGPKVFNSQELRELLSKGIDDLRISYESSYFEAARDLRIKIFGNPEEMKIDHLLTQIRLLNKRI